MTTAVATRALNVMENKELAKHEETISRGLASFVEVGRSLIAIRDGKLYRDEHKTFEKYCDVRWGIKRTRAYELINAATVSEQVSENSDTVRPKESHAAELAKCPAEHRKETWQEAVNTAPGGNPTAKHIAAVINKKFPSNPAAAFCHQLAPDDDDDGFEPDALDDRQPGGEIIDSHAVPDDEEEDEAEPPATSPPSHFQKFKAVWDEADEMGRAAIRAFILRKPEEDDE